MYHEFYSTARLCYVPKLAAHDKEQSLEILLAYSWFIPNLINRVGYTMGSISNEERMNDQSVKSNTCMLSYFMFVSRAVIATHKTVLFTVPLMVGRDA